MPLVRIDSSYEFLDLRGLAEVEGVPPQGVQGAVHGVEHSEGVVRLEGVNRVFELAGHRATARRTSVPVFMGRGGEFSLSGISPSVESPRGGGGGVDSHPLSA